MFKNFRMFTIFKVKLLGNAIEHDYICYREAMTLKSYWKAKLIKDFCSKAKFLKSKRRQYYNIISDSTL